MMNNLCMSVWNCDMFSCRVGHKYCNANKCYYMLAESGHVMLCLVSNDFH